MVAQQPLVMHLLLLLAPALGRLGTRTATNGAIRVTSVTPARFPREIATQLTIDGENFAEGMVVAIDGLSGNLYSADLSVYRPMRALNATVLSPTRAVVTTVPTQNGGPCTVRASPDGAGDWSDKASAPIASVFAAVEFAVGRRPYTVERTGALLATRPRTAEGCRARRRRCGRPSTRRIHPGVGTKNHCLCLRRYSRC